MVTRAVPVESPRKEGADPVASGDPVQIAWELAYSRARRGGAADEEARQAAQEFVTHMLERGLYVRHHGMEAHRFDAWLRRCLCNLSADTGRARARREKHESAWPEVERDDGRGQICDLADTGSPPDAELLRQEFWARLMAAVRGLPPSALGMFLRHYLDDTPIQELATPLGRSRHAVEQALYRLRARLRERLERAGLNEAELRAYTEALSNQGTRQRPPAAEANE